MGPESSPPIDTPNAGVYAERMITRLYRGAFRPLFVLLLCLYGCSEGTSTVTVGSNCTRNSDCESGQFCVDGQCKPGELVSCKSDEECPQDYKCLSDGTCSASAQCEINSDCCPADEAECGNICKNFACEGTDCISGQSKDCYVGCHRGVMLCEKGMWTPCDAPEVLDEELCDDGIDNDCNDEIDDGCAVCEAGEVQDCATLCGEGKEACTNAGTWGPCDAPKDCMCNPGESTSTDCGNCGTMEASCGDAGIWEWSPLCTGQGFCEISEEQVRDCGQRCGKQTRVCNAQCAWGEWSECQEGACEPGLVEEQGCGLCGSQSRECQSDCSWGAYGHCDEGGTCTVGETQEQPCGKCGTKTALCEDACGWGEFGACENEGSCSAEEVESRACGNCGQQERTCLSSCQWGEWGQCKDEGQCEPALKQSEACGPQNDVGECQYGEREQTCNDSCQWAPWSSCYGAVYPADEICGNGKDEDCSGQDETKPDDYEEGLGNNECGTCYHLGQDVDMEIYPTIDNPKDKVDCFRFYGQDNTNWNPFGSGEKIEIEVTGQPVGMDVDLFLYRGIDDCIDGNVLASSITVGGGDEVISWTEEKGTTDSGYFYVVVRPYCLCNAADEYNKPCDECTEGVATGTNCNKPYSLKIKGLL